MAKLGLFFCAMTFLALSCRTYHADSLTSIHLAGTVTAEDGRPVPAVTVYFVDVGFDEYLSQNRTEIELGTTDDDGLLDTTHRHMWGSARPRAEGAFELLFKKEGYRAETLRFEVSSLQTRDGVLVVPFDLMLREEHRPDVRHDETPKDHDPGVEQ